MDKRHTNAGGYREGSGRPRGSKKLMETPKKAILEYTSPQELQNMVARAKKWAKTDKKLLQWYLEMCFGKPKAIEKEEGKTVNNIALFLDKLEKQALNPPSSDFTTYVGDVTNGSTTTGQNVADAVIIYDQRPEPESDTVCAESGSEAF